MVGMNTDFQTTAEALRLDAVRLEIAATELAHSALTHTTVSNLRHHYTHTLGETPTTTCLRIKRRSSRPRSTTTLPRQVTTTTGRTPNASLMHSHMFVAALAVGRPPRLSLSRLPPSS